MEEPRYDFVRFATRKDGRPIILPQREDLVSLCVILNELAWPNIAGYIPEELQKHHANNEGLILGSEDDSHKVVIKPSVTNMQRINTSINGEVTICSEFTMGTDEILKIINKWDGMLRV